MSESSTPSLTDTPARRRRDAASWALTAVTIAVLGIGVLVIRSTTSQDAPAPDETVSNRENRSGEMPEIVIENPPEQWIVLEPTVSEPPLSPSDGPTLGQMPIGEAGLTPSETPLTAQQPGESGATSR